MQDGQTHGRCELNVVAQEMTGDIFAFALHTSFLHIWPRTGGTNMQNCTRFDPRLGARAYLFLSEPGGQRRRRQRPPRRGTVRQRQRRGRGRQQPGAAAAALSPLNDAHHLHRENDGSDCGRRNQSRIHSTHNRALTGCWAKKPPTSPPRTTADWRQSASSPPPPPPPPSSSSSS